MFNNNKGLFEMEKFYFLIAILIFNHSFTFAENAESADTLRKFRTPSITISTSKAEERRSPIPFSQITVSEIEKRHTVKDLPQILSELPSVLVFSENGNGVGYSNLTMRGFNQRRIAVLVNGIPQNDPEDHNMYWINFPDLASSIENIQVQRGAGLANYGFPAIGGSINLETSNFTVAPGATLETGVGFQEFGGQNVTEQNTSKFSIQASSGVIDEKYALYTRLSRINSLGYRDNSWAKLNGYFLGFARFDKNLTTQINVFGGPFADGLSYNGLPKSYIKDKKLRRHNYNFWMYDSTGENVSWITPRRKQEVENFSQPHYEMLNDWQISDKISLKSTLFFYSGKGFFDFDGTGWTDKKSFRLTPENGFPMETKDPENPIIRAFVYNRQGGWIPRLQINHNRGLLTIGAEVRIHRSEHWGKIQYAENLPPNYNPDYKFYSYNGMRNIFSSFIREEYKIGDNLTLTGEIQGVYHTYAIKNKKAGYVYTKYLNIKGDTVGNGAKLFDIHYFFVNPRIGANYNLDDNSNLYSFIAYTSREPRMKNLYDASSSYTGKKPLFKGQVMADGSIRYDFSKPIIKPESMLNFELGYTYRTDKYYFNANGYWMEYFDEFVKSGKLDIFGNPIDGNAPRTRHYGLEFQVSVAIFDNDLGKLDLSGNMTLSKNYIIEYDFLTDQGSKISLKNNPIAGFPDLLGNVRLTYRYGNFYISLLSKYVGDFRTDNFGDMLKTNYELKKHLDWDYYTDNKVNAYNIYNLDLSYKFEKLLGFNSIEIQGSIYNLFNKLYAASGEGKEFFPAAERNYYIGFKVQL